MKKQFWSLAILLCVVVSMLAACNAKTGETTLTAPEVTLSGKTVTWNAVEGAESYLVTVNGEEQDVGTALIYTLTITEPGSYDIYVTAVQGKNRKTSLKVTYTVSAELAAPQISLSGNTVQWEMVPGATAYEVFVNDACKSLVTETYYVVDEEAIGTYLIRVRAKNDTKTGGFSNEVTYTVSEQEGTLERLETPVIALDGKTVRWTPIKNATAYDILLNGVKKATVTECEYRITERVAGEYSVSIVATHNPEYLMSNPSNTLTYTVDDANLSLPILATTESGGVTYVAEICSDGYLRMKPISEITDFKKYMWYLEPDGEFYRIKLWNGQYLACGEQTALDGSEGYQAQRASVGESNLQWKIVNTDSNKYVLYNVNHAERWSSGEWVYSYGYKQSEDVLKFGTDTTGWICSNEDIPYVERTALTAPTLTISGNTVTWAAVENANAYEVYVNGILTVTQAELTYTITVRNASVYVIAVDTTDNYLDSSPSNTVKQFTMTAPVAIYDTSHNMLLTFDNDGLLVMSTTSKDDAVADYAAFAMQLIASGEYYRIKLANGKYLQHTVIGGTDRFVAAYKADSDAQLFKVTARVDGNFNFYPKDNEGYVICTDNNGSYNQYNDANYVGAIFVLFNVDATIAEDAVNEGTETSVLDRSVVAYYNQNGGAKTLASFDDSGVITVGAEYTTVTDYTEYLWTFEKITEGDYAGKYRIRLADGRYLSYYDNPNSGEVPQACAATKDEADTKQIWILVASGENSYKLENVYLRNYYSDVYLGEWFGSYKFNGGCNAWTFFNP